MNLDIWKPQQNWSTGFKNIKRNQFKQQKLSVIPNLNPPRFRFDSLYYNVYDKQLKKDIKTLEMVKSNYQQFGKKHKQILNIIINLSLQKKKFKSNDDIFAVEKSYMKQQLIYDKKQNKLNQQTMCQTAHKKYLSFNQQDEEDQQNEVRNFSFGNKKKRYESPKSNRTFILDLQDLIN